MIAQDRHNALQETVGAALRRLGQLTGAQLAGSTYRHPLADEDAAFGRVSPVVVGGDYITTETGTGAA